MSIKYALSHPCTNQLVWGKEDIDVGQYFIMCVTIDS